MKDVYKIIAVSLLLGAIAFWQNKALANRTTKKREMKNNNNFTESDAKTAIEKVKDVFGRDEAKIVERLMRLETAHFKSDQYKKTGSPGMEIGGKNTTYPYGWRQPVKFWDDNPRYKPTGIYTRPENKTGIKKSFIVFPSVTAAALTLAYILKQRNWNAGSWYSTNIAKQNEYNAYINKISNRFIL